jgi:predicted transcriptional regulator
MTDGWQKEVSGQMKRLKHSLEARRVQKKGVPNPEKQKIEALTGKVEEVLKAIDEDKSKGVHNFIYAKKLMSEAEKKALAAQKSFSKGLQ